MDQVFEVPGEPISILFLDHAYEIPLERALRAQDRENSWREDVERLVAHRFTGETVQVTPRGEEAGVKALPDAIAKRYGGCADSVLLQISADDDVDRLAECVAEIQKIPAPIDG